MAFGEKKNGLFIRKFQDDDGEFIHLKIRTADAMTFLNYSLRIQDLINSKKEIPVEIYEKMMGLLKPKDEDKENYYAKIQDDVLKNVMSFLKRPRMKYDFSIEVENKKTHDEDFELSEDFEEWKNSIQKGNNKNTITLSLQNMIEHLIFIAINCFIENTDKEKCVTDCYQYIDEYTKKDKRIRKLYSHYKINVISGYISWRFGFDIGKQLRHEELGDNLPTTGILNGAVQYCTDPYNTYPKKKKRR